MIELEIFECRPRRRLTTIGECFVDQRLGRERVCRRCEVGRVHATLDRATVWSDGLPVIWWTGETPSLEERAGSGGCPSSAGGRRAPRETGPVMVDTMAAGVASLPAQPDLSPAPTSTSQLVVADEPHELSEWAELGVRPRVSARPHRPRPVVLGPRTEERTDPAPNPPDQPDRCAPRLADRTRRVSARAPRRRLPPIAVPAVPAWEVAC